MAPTDLLELHKKILEAAKDFGYREGKNALLRDCIIDKKTNLVRTVMKGDANFWFGFVREDQPSNGAYDGLSFVIFPEEGNNHCLVSIGIGSSSLGKDGDLAQNPGFRRSFMRLKGNSDAKFFFKLRFDDMETSTPGLQKELYSTDAMGNNVYEDVIINTSTKYNADSSKEAPGLLPAAFIVDYTTEDGWDLILSWLAQYARWRCWDKFGTGSDIPGNAKKINEAISRCRVSLDCPTTNEIYNILKDKKYVVLQGAPGCGKTWSANEVATKFSEVVFIQFHAETTYSDFVYGIRPVLDGTTLAYKGEKGVLLKAIEKAKDSKGKVLLIIDEINRANLANVLGPVFYLFEPNTKRNHKLHLGTEWEDQQEKPIELDKLPTNLYVLATMNTADKSLAVVDFALRRRFAWVTLYPHKLDINGFDTELFEKVDELFSRYATDEELNLQPGQSYFMNWRKRRENIKFGLMPLMKEYFAEGFLLSAKEEFAQLFTSYTDTYMYK
ncbi:MAG: AAA family ATPase [Bacteroidales bacterium]|nr:AAA family ATPase [Bacteroidales bacterium]